MTGTENARSGWRRLMADGRPVGLLAAAGRFPIVFAEKAQALAGCQSPAWGSSTWLPQNLIVHSTQFTWAGLGRLGKVIRWFRRQRVSHIVMAGKVHKTELLKPWRILQLLPDCARCGSGTTAERETTRMIHCSWA